MLYSAILTPTSSREEQSGFSISASDMVTTISRARMDRTGTDLSAMTMFLCFSRCLSRRTFAIAF